MRRFLRWWRGELWVSEAWVETERVQGMKQQPEALCWKWPVVK